MRRSYMFLTKKEKSLNKVLKVMMNMNNENKCEESKIYGYGIGTNTITANLKIRREV